jgi:hypothetical protein
MPILVAPGWLAVLLTAVFVPADRRRYRSGER